MIKEDDIFIDGAFVINIDGQYQRWNSVQHRFKVVYPDLKLERWSAKTPRDGDVAFIWRKYSQSNTTDYDRAVKKSRAIQTAGMLAYSMTWVEILKEAKIRGLRRVLVMDDDVIPTRDFSIRIQKLHKLPSTAKLILLGASQWTWALGVTYKRSKTPGFYHPLYTDGSFAVIVHRDIFDLLIWEGEKHANVFDSGPLRAIYRRYQLDCYVMQPNSIIADVRSSNLRGAQDMLKRARLMRWDMALFNIAIPHPHPPMVSVIMTCHNCEDTLEYAVASILKQTHQHIEVIIIDDGSITNVVGKLIESLKRQDGRIHSKRIFPAIGTYNARNVGLKMAHGSIYANHDCDDIALPNRLELQLRPILDNRVDATFSYHIRSHAPLSIFTQSLVNGIEWFQRQVNAHRTHKYPNGAYKYCCREKLGLMTFVGRMNLFDELGPFFNTSFSGDSEFVERLLHTRKGLLMSHPGTAYNWHAFLEKLHPKIPGVLEVIPVTTVLAYGGNTMSKKVPIGGQARLDFETRYRYKMLHTYNNASNVYYY